MVAPPPVHHPQRRRRRRRHLRVTTLARWLLPLFLWMLITTAAAPTPAAAAPAPANPNLLTSNAGFETPATFVEDNVWDGVGDNGYLSGFRQSARIVNDRGAFESLPMPISVAYVDLNGDGKPDLVTADPTGYFRFYPNRGTAQAPVFGSGQLLPIFLSTTFHPREHHWTNNNRADDWRSCPRFALADWRHTGLLDFLVGNYYGETFFLPNVGSARQPAFRQPAEGRIDAARILTNEKNPFWGNLLSPVACDWNGNGRLDALFGEGTYSANAIHLFQNVGSADLPKFTEAKHTRVAYGDGREQLIPAVADYEGDGNPTLLIADRTGEIGVYRNAVRPRPDTELPRIATLSFGGKSKLPGLVSPYAVDFNGDGLFDLVLGLPTGHVAVALNTGTRGNPVFGPLQELKADDRLGRTVRQPPGWLTATFAMYGNALAYFNVVSAGDDPASNPPEGTHCLKAGYWPQPADALFGIPPEGIPGALKHFTLYTSALNLENNKPYTVTFKARNSGMDRLTCSFSSHFSGILRSAKIERGERGEIKNRDARADEWMEVSEKFNAGSDWTTVRATLTPRYKNPELQDQATIPCQFNVDFWATNLSAVMYLDDFSIVKQGQ